MSFSSLASPSTTTPPRATINSLPPEILREILHLAAATKRFGRHEVRYRNTFLTQSISLTCLLWSEMSRDLLAREIWVATEKEAQDLLTGKGRLGGYQTSKLALHGEGLASVTPESASKVLIHVGDVHFLKLEYFGLRRIIEGRLRETELIEFDNIAGVPGLSSLELVGTKLKNTGTTTIPLSSLRSINFSYYSADFPTPYSRFYGPLLENLFLQGELDSHRDDISRLLILSASQLSTLQLHVRTIPALLPALSICTKLLHLTIDCNMGVEDASALRNLGLRLPSALSSFAVELGLMSNGSVERTLQDLLYIIHTPPFSKITRFNICCDSHGKGIREMQDGAKLIGELTARGVSVLVDNPLAD